MFYLTWEAVDNPIAGVVTLTCLFIVATTLRVLVRCCHPKRVGNVNATPLWRALIYHALTTIVAMTMGYTAAQFECATGILVKQILKESLEVLAFVFLVGFAQARYLRHDDPGIYRQICDHFGTLYQNLLHRRAHYSHLGSASGNPNGLNNSEASSTVDGVSMMEMSTPSSPRGLDPDCEADSKDGILNEEEEKIGGAAEDQRAEKEHCSFRKAMWPYVSMTSAVGIVLFYWLLASVVWYSVVALLEGRSCVVNLDTIPHLDLEPTLTISGSSAGGDMAVQFHVAYSRIVSGSCGFTGQPYRCAITHFSNETLVRRNESCEAYDCAAPYDVGMAVPHCVDASGAVCGANLTLRYDHCKFFPSAVKVGELEQVVRATPVCAQNRSWHDQIPGCIDDADQNLPGARAYGFRGQYDSSHRKGVCKNSLQLFKRWARNPGRQLKLNDYIRIGHTTPMPWMCRGNTFNGESLDTAWAHQIRPCEGPPMDGAGECMRWMYDDDHGGGNGGGGKRLKDPFVWNAWYQTKIPTDWLSQYHLHARVEVPARHGYTGQDNTFYAFIPRDCRKGARCRLHVHLYGCHDAPHNPLDEMGYARKDARLLTSNFHVWAATNKIVVLYPINPANPRLGSAHPDWGNTGTKACWDAYGETGLDYATQTGLHMKQIRFAIDALSHGKI